MTIRRSAASYDSASPWSLALAHPRLVLIVLSLLMFVPGIASIPPLDRDESRFTQATKQMIETGDFIEIRFQDEARNKKPIGIYWMQAVTAGWLSGEPYNSIWAYRVPSVIGGILAVLFIFGIGAKLFDEETGLIGAGLMASSLLLIGETHIAKTDAVLLAFVTGAQLMVAHFFVAARQGAAQPPLRDSILLGLAFGLGFLVKGPMIVFFVGLTVIALSAWEGRWKWISSMRPFLGLAIVILINVPWLVAIGLVTNGKYFSESIGQDFFGKALSAQESHWGPPGYYLATLLVGFWPGWLFLAPGIVYSIARSREGAVRFLLAWLIPAWIVLELAPTKLPHYPLPLYPALALLCAAAIMAGVRESRSFLDNAPVKIGAALWLMMTIALVGALVFYLPGAYGTGSSVFLWVLAVPIIAASAIAVLFLLRGEGENASAAAVVAGAIFAAVALAGVLPRLDQVMISRNAANLIARSGALPNAVAVVGFHEPSLVFQVGTPIRLSPSPADAADFLTKTPNSVALVEKNMESEFHQRLTQQNFTAEPLGNVKGLNYSNGDHVTLTLYRLKKTGP
ncbi:MAG: glycosyltransferase family 39 protein [Alphaproteobacteria bacterium]|nr:glycosyltransferase family 39 protein [Alphaproteobacteria bacterium]